jgi:hypothetical protein
MALTIAERLTKMRDAVGELPYVWHVYYDINAAGEGCVVLVDQVEGTPHQGQVAVRAETVDARSVAELRTLCETAYAHTVQTQHQQRWAAVR